LQYCYDQWRQHFQQEKGFNADDYSKGTILNDENIKACCEIGNRAMCRLQADTWYALYVQTKLINHPGARNAISNITFFRTHFAHPEPPRIISVDESRPGEIPLIWEAPVKPNGQITHYIVKWKAKLDDVESLRHWM
jgi:hypothetical protein